jgi:hypothetical protein
VREIQRAEYRGAASGPPSLLQPSAAPRGCVIAAEAPLIDAETCSDKRDQLS